jgi:hypothetical protein
MSSPRNLHQLLLVKQLYEDASLHAGYGDTFSHTKSVILLDLSVEMVLNNIVLNLDPDLTVNASKGSQDTDRRTLWGNAASAINKAKSKRLLEIREMANLHSLRNLVQHNGTEPTQTEVKRYLSAAELMLTAAFRDAYELDFANFRIWDVIENDDLRRWLKESEDFLSEGNVKACIVGCILAHQWIVKAIRQQTKESRARASISYELKGSRAAEALQKIRKELIEDIELLENEMVAIGVGLPVMATRRFLRLTRVILVFIAEAGNIQVRGKGDPQENDPTVANYMLEYLVRLINLVEDGDPGVLNTIKVKIFPSDQKIWQKANGKVAGQKNNPKQ